MAEEHYHIKLYKRRWINIFLFVMYTINNGIHWAQFSVINESIAEYYKVPHAYIEWTAGVYSLSYILFVTPALYAMENNKIRHIMILVSSLSTVGAWTKVFSVMPDRFIFALFGQFIIAASYSFTFGGSARIISTWFGVHESSRASALSLFGDQVGGAISFIIPSIMMQKSSDVAVWEGSLRRMHIVNACLSTLCLFLIILCIIFLLNRSNPFLKQITDNLSVTLNFLVFKNEPKHPPSMIQVLKMKKKKEYFIRPFPKMLKNRAFLMLLFWYSIGGALMNVFGAVLGEIIAINLQDSSDDAGRIGFIMTGVAILTTPLIGYVMDKTHKFKEIGATLSTGTFISFLSFTIMLKMNIIYIYINAIFIGIFVSSIYVNCIQIGIEILYPITEDKCAALMVFVKHIISFIFIFTYGTVLRTYGDTAANILFCIITFSGSLVSIFTPVKLNRQNAEQGANSKELKQFLSLLQTAK